MEIKLLCELEKSAFSDDIIGIMKESDNDFVPPISKRVGTTQMNFSSSEELDGIEKYFLEMKNQEILAAIEGGALVGFVSFKENYVCDAISKQSLPNIYVSTLMIAKSARGNGLSAKMYSVLFEHLYSHCNVFTRTWSTNFAHTKILTRFGFSEILRKQNDRGDGIDTVYYKKEKSRVAAAL